MKVILVLNGPPGAGKDTIGSLLTHHGYEIASFKDPMWAVAREVLGPTLYEEFFIRYGTRDLKENPWDAINGLSPRQLFIKISEDWVKPLMGDGHFGYLAADKASERLEELQSFDRNKGLVFTDGGFGPEIHDLGLIPGAVVLVIRLYRDGYTFEGDSRSYMDESFLDVHLTDGNPQEAVDTILESIHERI